MGWGGRFKREGTYACLWLIHVDVWQRPTHYCKAIILQLKINTLKIITKISNNDSSYFIGTAVQVTEHNLCEELNVVEKLRCLIAVSRRV